MPSVWVCIGIALVVYAVGLVAYRLYLSPLANFPGPKLAAATLLYEFYYDVICRGQYTFKIKQLHDEYGMCDDPLPQEGTRHAKNGMQTCRPDHSH